MTGETLRSLETYRVYPANQYVTTKDKLGLPARKLKMNLRKGSVGLKKETYYWKLSESACEPNMTWKCLKKLAFATE